MPTELRGLVTAIVAGLAALGAAFGFAAVLRATQPAAPRRAAAQPGAPPGPGADPHAVLVAQGLGFYAESCARCHGKQGQGGIGPDLRHSDQSDSQITDVIVHGVSGAMPAFGTKYKAPDVQALVAAVRTFK